MTRANLLAESVWRDLNGGQQSAVRQILGHGVWRTDETALSTETRRRKSQ